jgi:hypothetical protein
MSTTQTETYLPRLPSGDLDPNAFVDVKTACRISFQSPQTLWRLLQKKRLRRYKLNDRTLVKVGELLALIQVKD